MKISRTSRNVTASEKSVKQYRNRRNPNKYIEVKDEGEGHQSARQYMKWDTSEGEVKNYNGSKSSRGRYSRVRKDTLNQMLDEYDEVTSSEENLDDDIELETAEQEYDSAETSINSSKLPAVYKLINIPEGTVGVDFGGGKFDNAVEHIKDLGATLCVYDPYNRSAEHNKEVLRILRRNGGADWAINSNVLNVIKENDARKAVLNNIKKITKSGAPIYITVYEGNGKGEGKATKAGYQLNRKTADYLEEIQEVFPDATRRGKLITAHNSNSVNSSTDVYSIDTDFSELQSELWTKLKLMAIEDFYFDEDMVSDFFRVDLMFVEDNMLRIEVGAEVSYDGMVRIIEGLDPIIQSWYEDAYFDCDAPGIMSAYIPLDEDVDACTAVEGSTTRYHDIESELVEVSLDTDITINEDGSWDYDDESWANLDSSKDGWVYSDNYPSVSLIDTNGLIEIVDDFIVDELPEVPGRYHVNGDFELYFDIDGVFDEVHDGGWDEREGYWEDYDTYSDIADASYNKDESKMTNFSCESLNKFN